MWESVTPAGRRVGGENINNDGWWLRRLAALVAAVVCAGALTGCAGTSTRTVTRPDSLGGPVPRASAAAKDTGITGIAATARTRPLIRAVRSLWSYEASSVPLWDPSVHIRRSKDHPEVVRVRFSHGTPEFAIVGVRLVSDQGYAQQGAAAVVFERSRKNWEQITDVQTRFSDDCRAGTPIEMRQLLCPNPWRKLRLKPTALPNPPYRVHLASSDLHRVDWSDATLPAQVCGASQPIRLSHKPTFVHSALWPWWATVQVSGAGKAVYGMLALGGSPQPVAAVGVMCSNAGGTADGQLRSSYVVFRAMGDSLRVVGILTPRQPLNPQTSHVPLLYGLRFNADRIIVKEAWYGPDDGTCCSSGRAVTTWRYVAGRLHANRTVVKREPRGE